MPNYSKGLTLAWNIAAHEAVAGKSLKIESAHLLLGLCKLCDLDLEGIFSGQPDWDINSRLVLRQEVETLCQAIRRVGLDVTGFRRRLRIFITKPGVRPVYSDGIVHRSSQTHQIFSTAESLAMQSPGGGMVGLMHLLRALQDLQEKPWSDILIEMGMPSAFEQILALENVEVNQPSAVNLPVAGAQSALGVDKSGSSTPFLDHFGRDLSQMARDGKLDPIIGRRDEMRTLARILTQKRKSNAIIVGEAGVGKTGVVEGFAQRIISDEAPESLRGKRIIEISMAGILAGTKHRGEFEERMQHLIDEASQNQDTILFIDEIHTVLGAGGEGASDAANILKPALARGNLHCIGATTITEFRNYIEKDSALERRFQIVWVEEPTRVEAVEILKGLRRKFEEHHNVEISDSAIEAAVDLSIRYLPDFHLPDKAIDLIDQACATALIKSLSGGAVVMTPTTIERAEIAAAVSQRSRIPVERLTEDEAQRLLSMEEKLKHRVIGQDEAVQAISTAIRTAKAGLKDPHKPIGVFLFVGATGTGKTELAKALAEFLFDNERRLIRIDMSEYMERHAVSRLIGAPPGYLGHDEEGQLTGPVRTHPYSVVLFDEIEKAHPEVLDIFLQIFDDGRLTDSHGRHVSFAETVIVLTSNLGSAGEPSAHPLGFLPDHAAGKELDAATQAYRQGIMTAIRSELRPELINRIQHIVYFYPLGEAVVRQIIDKFLGKLRARLEDREIDLALTDAAYALLMQEGFDPRYGAREMERAVDRLLVQPLGKALLEGRFPPGAELKVDAQDRQLVLEDTTGTRAINLNQNDQ
jgi:ATP-dependent Clp protease ATP-binding subunit ClpC